MYNEISEGEYKGWFKLEELIPPEGAKMSIWTKEQSADLDKRFSEVNNRIDNVEINLNKRIDNVEINLNKRIDGVESKVDEILSILKNK